MNVQKRKKIAAYSSKAAAYIYMAYIQQQAIWQGIKICDNQICPPDLHQADQTARKMYKR